MLLLQRRGEGQYTKDTPKRVMAIGADGATGPKTCKLLKELEALREDHGTVVPDDYAPSLCAKLAVALAQQEAASYAAWKVEMERYATVKAVREAAVVAQGATTMVAELVRGATSANTQGAAGGGTTSE